MRKFLAMAFVGGILLASCGKKAENNLQDSNTMLEEPEVDMAATDSNTAAPQVTPPVAVPNPSPSTDSTAAAK